MNHKIVYIILTISLFLVEIGIAIFPTTHFIRSYFGDLLVVILIYCAIKVVVDSEPKRLGGCLRTRIETKMPEIL